MSILIAVGSVIMYREIQYTIRRNKEKQAEEDFKTSLQSLNSFLEKNPEIKLTHLEVQKMAQIERQSIRDWLTNHPEQTTLYLAHLGKLQRIIALAESKPSS